MLEAGQQFSANGVAPRDPVSHRRVFKRRKPKVKSRSDVGNPNKKWSVAHRRKFQRTMKKIWMAKRKAEREAAKSEAK